MNDTHVRDAGDRAALEVVSVELLDGGSEVGCGLVLDESFAVAS